MTKKTKKQTNPFLNFLTEKPIKDSKELNQNAEIFTAIVLLAQRYIVCIDVDTTTSLDKYQKFMSFCRQYCQKWENEEGEEGELKEDLAIFEPIINRLDQYICGLSFNQNADEFKFLILVSGATYIFKKQLPFLFAIVAKSKIEGANKRMIALSNNPINKRRKLAIRDELKKSLNDSERSFKRNLTKFKQTDKLQDSNIVKFIENNLYD